MPGRRFDAALFEVPNNTTPQPVKTDWGVWWCLVVLGGAGDGLLSRVLSDGVPSAL
jgi:hypothetical protein